jgi:hypothetical protein
MRRGPGMPVGTAAHNLSESRMADVPQNAAEGAGSVDAFIDAARRSPALASDAGARLIFALDATMSRQPTWNLAAELQGRMFETAASLNGLAVQLVYFRGLSECRASPFISEGKGLARFMRSIRVAGGLTQIARVLAHARDEARRARVGALVFVGDAVEERSDRLQTAAGELALLGVKAFLFQEGTDEIAARTFRDIATVTGGAYARFDASAPKTLAALLAGAAAYASGGTQGLAAVVSRTSDAEAANLLAQLR